MGISYLEFEQRTVFRTSFILGNGRYFRILLTIIHKIYIKIESSRWKCWDKTLKDRHYQEVLEAVNIYIFVIALFPWTFCCLFLDCILCFQAGLELTIL